MFTTDDARRLAHREAAHFLTSRGYRMAATTLAKYVNVSGPTYSKFGVRPTYTGHDLFAWVAGVTTSPLRSSSEQQAA